MKIEQRRIGTVDIFTPMGALVDQDAEAFCKSLLQRISSGGSNLRVGVAMHEVPYMDSTALEGLVQAAEQLNDRATTLKLAAVTPTCREIFELTGLSPRFRFFTDVEGVVKSFLT